MNNSTSANHGNHGDSGLEVVAEAIGLLLGTHDWAAKPGIIEREQELLLSELADDALTRLIENFQTSADENERPLADYAALHRTLLRRCREIGIADAWVEFEAFLHVMQSAHDAPETNQRDDSAPARSQPVDDADRNAVMQALDIFVNKPPRWEEKRKILEGDQALLLSLTADQLLGESLKLQRANGNEKSVRTLEWNRRLLQRCREVGIADAWAEADAALRQAVAAEQAPDVSPLKEPLIDWLTPRSHREERRFLEAHPELLSAESDAILRELLWLNYGAPGETVIRRAQRLLSDIRARGGTIQAIRDSYVNEYGGFSLDLPNWLETVLAQYEHLLDSDHPSQSAAERLTLLRAAYQRAVDDPAVPQAALASLANNLSVAITEDPHVSQTEGFTEALQALITARAIYLFEQFPYQYAMIQHNLGNTYGKWSAGNRRDNLEEAIVCYRDALRARTLTNFPEDYAMTQNNLGITYRERLAGDRRDNLEESIACFREALRVRTLANFPQQYAATQNNLGVTYRHRLAGDRRDNLEAAITCFHEALRVRTLAAAPLDYAMTQNNLGLVYHDRMAGDRYDNLEAAIVCYEKALQVITLANFPETYAAIQNNRGNVYSERLAGNRKDNLETAIVCYREALRVRTPTDYPQQYAQTQYNLGHLYQNELADYDRSSLQEAIRCYHEALRVYTLADFPINFRNTQLNLAWLALTGLARDAEAEGDSLARKDALEMAHNAFLEGRHAQAEMGWLTSDVKSRTSLQGEQATVRELYAHDAWCLWQLGRLDEAITALEAGRAQALSEALAIVGISLSPVCEEHQSAYLDARQQLNQARAADDRRQMRSARDHFLAVREAIRAHCYPDFLPSEPDYTTIASAPAPEQTLVYLAATDQTGFACILPPNTVPNTERRTPIIIPLPRLTWQTVDTWLVQYDEQGVPIGGLRLALEHLATSALMYWLQHIDSAEEWARIQTMPLCDVAEVIPAHYGTLKMSMERTIAAWRDEADILSGGSLAEQAWAKALRERMTMPLGTALAQSVLSGDLDWFFLEAELETLLPELSDAAMLPLREALDQLGLRSPDQPIALIPCGRLGVLPLHAASVSHPLTGALVPFAETCELTLQPNARVLAAARKTAEGLPQNGPIISVGNPRPTRDPDLPWAAKEAEANALLGRRAGRRESRSLLHEEATRKLFLETLADIRARKLGALVEVASHGHSDPADPQRCFMVLAYGEWLTLADLQREQLLMGTRCFSAAGCVTGLGDLKVAPDELGSFAAGVLQAGSPAALATLWPVDDRATFLLMLRFHQEMLANSAITPARALRQAARWLREASTDEVKRVVKTGLKGIRSARGGSDMTTPEDGVNETDETDETDEADEADEATVAVRGVTGVATPDTADADMPDNSSLDDTVGTLRMTAAEVLNHVSRLNNANRGRPPYAHPIYWACAIVYGA